MERTLGHLLFSLAILLAGTAQAQLIDDTENGCVLCHGNPDVWDDETGHLLVTAADLATDIHWQKGIRCHDCHGGNVASFNLREAHATEDGFRAIESPAGVAAFCGHCHSNAETMQAANPSAANDTVERFLAGVHGRHLEQVGGPQAATCLSCHPPHKMRAADDSESSVHPRNLVETCGNCHVDQRTLLRKGVHHAAGERNQRGAGTALDCMACHGSDAHGMLPVADPQSPAFLDNQVRVCGSCHEKYLDTYEASVHGQGLRESGLLVTAVCSDCHRAHDIYYAADRRSSLHAANVAETCGKCHALLQERIERSVHRSSRPASEESATLDERLRAPSCVDCHQGHDQPQPQSAESREHIPHRCGNCHADYALRYGMSLHGQLTQRGYKPAATCSDCHGAHDVLPVSDSQSRMAPANRFQTCQQCHPQALRSLTAFDPHANFKDERLNPGLHAIYAWIETVLYLLFGIFVIHACFWFARAMIHALQYGRQRRPVANQPGVIRFQPLQRWAYGLGIIAFLGLTMTGLPLKYSHYPWAQTWAGVLGGFQSARVWHHFFGLLLLLGCLLHVANVVREVYRVRKRSVSWKTLFFGPDSPAPNRRDARDLLGMLRWFVGLSRKPHFERWTYWEKLDYWAVFVGAILIVGSGLVLWYPSLFSLLLPRGTLNAAHVVHAETALLIGGCLFVIHLFNTHLRPEKFPLDLSLLTGVITQEHLRTYRPEFLTRMEQEGRLEHLLTFVPSHGRLRMVLATGFVLLILGLVLLTWMLVAFLEK